MTEAPRGEVASALQRLSHACDQFGMALEEALLEKADELAVRQFLRCMPNDRIKDSQVVDFVREVLGRWPSAEFLRLLQKSARGPRLAEEELIELENRQNGRCALCGRFLGRGANPQVDHVTPVSLGGESHMANYQLLCQQCNLGKSKLIGWIMGAPFFSGTGRQLTTKLRYCALAHARARCLANDCELSSRFSELQVIPIVPVPYGGRWIFDNLTVLCMEHARERERSIKKNALGKVQRARYARQLGLSSPVLS